MGLRSRIQETVTALASKHRVLLANFSYITALELVAMLVPLVTYPYLTRILGKEVYGMVITAQVLAGYASMFVDFGFKAVAARHVAIHRNDKKILGELLSAVLGVRLLVWICIMAVFFGIVVLVPSFRGHGLLFGCAFLLTLNELLFPQFFFQGIEKMKYISIINISIRLFSLMGIFLLVRKPGDDYLVVTILGFGYLLAGIASLAIIHWKEGVQLVRPKRKWVSVLMKDSLPIFATDLVCSIKDKVNYFLLGAFVSMGSVVVYDLGIKLITLLAKPMGIIGIVLFPRISATRSKSLLLKSGWIVLGVTVSLTIITIFFVPWIGLFFIPGFDKVWLLRVFLLVAPLLAISSHVASNYLIAFGKGKYMFYSIIVTTIAYIATIGVLYAGNWLNTVGAFMLIAGISYTVEFLYRAWVTAKTWRDDT